MGQTSGVGLKQGCFGYGQDGHSALATVGQTSGVGLKQGCFGYGQDGHRCLSWYFTSTETIRLIRDGGLGTCE